MDLPFVFALAAIASVVGVEAYVSFIKRKSANMKKVFAEGELLVTGSGEVIIDEVLPRSRALLVSADEYISVCFDPSEPGPPPCAGGTPDELDWELFLRKHHERRGDEELKLKITWTVQTARTIVWKIEVPV
jgi:hypothetical protein